MFIIHDRTKYSLIYLFLAVSLSTSCFPSHVLLLQLSSCSDMSRATVCKRLHVWECVCWCERGCLSFNKCEDISPAGRCECIFSPLANWESCQLFLLRRSRFDSLVFNSLNDALMSDASDTEYIVHLNIICRIIFYNCPYNYLLFITATMLFDLMFSENNPCWSCHLVSLLALIGINEIIMWESDTSQILLLLMIEHDSILNWWDVCKHSTSSAFHQLVSSLSALSTAQPCLGIHSVYIGVYCTIQ